MNTMDPFELLNAKRISSVASVLDNHPEIRRDVEATKRNEVASSAPKIEPMPERNWPDRLADEAFHGVAGEFVRTIEPHSEADPAAVLLQLLVAFGSVVGGSPHFMVGATAHRLNEFLLVVGRSAKARKGTSLGEVRATLGTVDEVWERSRVLPGLSSGEGVIFHVRDERWGRNKKGEVELLDEGVADRRLLIIESEFASALKVMQREGNTLSPILRCAWDGVALGTLTKNCPLAATRSHVSVIGHVTEHDLHRFLSANDQANGFANRFLVCCARRSKVLPDGGVLPAEQAQRLNEKMRSAVEAARQIELMTRSAEASEIWRKVYPDLSREDEPGIFGSLIARAEAHALRLSMAYALLDGSEVIEAVHLRAALAVWEFCEDSIRYLFGDVLGDPTADVILQALRQKPEGLTRTDLSRLFSGHKSADEVGRALESLKRLNRAEFQEKETDGRPVELWFALAGVAKKAKEAK
jgi:hypothetical protein